MNRDIIRSFRTQVTPLPPLKVDFTGKIVVVTGANVGLGKEAARHFVHANAAKVILACRSVGKGEKARAEIEKGEGKTGVAEVWEVDIGSFDSVKAFCARVNELPRLDAFISNAGLQTFTCEANEGYERQVTVHAISPFLITLLLLPIMRKTMAEFQTVPHMVIVGSNGHMYTKFEARNNAESVFEAVRGDHDMRHRYFDTKLMELFAAREMAKRLSVGGKPLIVLNIVDPGYCQSDLMRTKEWGKKVTVMMAFFSMTLARTSEMGARTYVMAATAGPDSHGKYLEDCELSTPSPFVDSEEGGRLQLKIFDELVAILERAQPGITEHI